MDYSNLFLTEENELVDIEEMSFWGQNLQHHSYGHTGRGQGVDPGSITHKNERIGALQKQVAKVQNQINQLRQQTHPHRNSADPHLRAQAEERARAQQHALEALENEMRHYRQELQTLGAHASITMH